MFASGYFPDSLKGRYRLIEQIGSGGMAVVYRAHDETLNRDVAIKALTTGIGQEASNRFFREARTVARLAHPNIVTLYDADRDGPWHYLVLEYISGQDLGAALIARGGTFEATEAVRAVLNVLAALDYAHGQGVIHRDIKPQNIIMAQGGQVKVADFGLALVQGDTRLTQSGALVGTVMYLAPERLMGGTEDHRADLYAVGAVLYELLTGHPPYQGSTISAILSQILTSSPPRPRQANPAIPTALESTILKLMAKHPDERYQSASEAIEALRTFAEHKDDGRDAEETELLTIPTQPPAEDIRTEVARFAAVEDAASALEAERKRLAKLLETNVIEPLNLMLSQATIYEQTLAGNPQARMAASVLASLARQVVQGARDLGANLNPTVLEMLGLEPALEALANQFARSRGLQTRLLVERLRERLPSAVELVLFRAAQEGLDRALNHARASEVIIQLERREDRVHLRLADNGPTTSGIDLLASARKRIQQIGGIFETRPSPDGGLEIVISLPIEKPIQLTAREIDVLQLLAEGLSNKEIARALGVTARTVNFHLDNLYSKLGVNTRTEAVIYALRRSWIRRREG